MTKLDTYAWLILMLLGIGKIIYWLLEDLESWLLET